MELLSKHTRIAFREHFVGWTLSTIADLFDAEDIPRSDIPHERLPSGQRRGLVEQYYASVDWTSSSDVRKVLRVYEHVIFELELPALGLNGDEVSRQRERQKLLNFLRRDGYSYEAGRLVGEHRCDLGKIETASMLVDRSVLSDHLRRIEQGIDGDPAQAIGSAKELLESIAKQILTRYRQDHAEFDSLQQLVKACMKALDLSVEAIPDASKGASSLKQVLTGLNQIVGGTAELRNLYGTGHGRTRRSGMQPRHARLVVGAVSTLAIFLLETLDDRQKTITTTPSPV